MSEIFTGKDRMVHQFESLMRLLHSFRTDTVDQTGHKGNFLRNKQSPVRLTLTLLRSIIIKMLQKFFRKSHQ